MARSRGSGCWPSWGPGGGCSRRSTCRGPTSGGFQRQPRGEAVSAVHNAVPGADLRAVLPEGILAAGGMGLLLLGASLRKRRPGLLAGATIVVLALAAGAALLGIGHYRSAFDDRIALDGFATFAKVLLCAAGAVAVIAAYSFLKQEEAPQPELFALVVFATAGMMLM